MLMFKVSSCPPAYPNLKDSAPGYTPANSRFQFLRHGINSRNEVVNVYRVMGLPFKRVVSMPQELVARGMLFGTPVERALLDPRPNSASRLWSIKSEQGPEVVSQTTKVSYSLGRAVRGMIDSISTFLGKLL